MTTAPRRRTKPAAPPPETRAQTVYAALKDELASFCLLPGDLFT